MKKISTFTLLMVTALCFVACRKEAVRDGYQDRFEYTSPLEKKYSVDGSYNVTHKSKFQTKV